MNKDFLQGGASAANQYEGGYDVRKNHEQASFLTHPVSLYIFYFTKKNEGNFTQFKNM